MAKWKIPVEWAMSALIDIEAETLEEAMEIARDDIGNIELPIDGEYIDGSWQLEMDDTERVRECYNTTSPKKY